MSIGMANHLRPPMSILEKFLVKIALLVLFNFNPVTDRTGHDHSI
jgi:hypothetical protein